MQETKFYQIARGTPRATESQKIEKKKINIVIKEVQAVIFRRSFVFGVHDFSISVNIDLTSTLN